MGDASSRFFKKDTQEKAAVEEEEVVDDDEDEGEEETGDEGDYEVETIEGSRSKNGRTEYYVRWVGYGDNDRTWEPEENLAKTAATLLARYQDTQKKTPGGKKRARVDTCETVQ